MIRIYCEGVHKTELGLCPDCTEMKTYTTLRLEECPFQERKKTCVNCKVHCYQAVMREKIRVVMRTAGPQMLTRHPYLALRHLLDGFQKSPRRR